MAASRAKTVTLLPNGKLKIEFPYNLHMVARISSLASREFVREEGCWMCPPTKANILALIEYGFSIPDGLEKAKERKSKLIGTEVVGLKRKLREFQKEGVTFFNERRWRLLLADEQGLGKEVIASSLILTALGWRRIDTLRVGDRVYGKNGKLCSVTGVYPQGVKPLYRVTFCDDTSVLAGAEHLWSVCSYNDRKRNRGWRVENTEFLKKHLHYSSGVNVWEIPMVDPIQYPEQDLLIPPYLLGVLIGDGCLLDGTCKFVPGDIEVPMIVRSLLPDDYVLTKGADHGTSTAYFVTRKSRDRKNAWNTEMRAMGLNVRGESKFIPQVYLSGSEQQRKQLLAGLLDSDGTTSGARVRYATTSKRLADDVIVLVRSLGGIATISTGKGRYRTDKEKPCQEKDLFSVGIRLPFNPFLRPSNRKKWKVSADYRRSIKSIEYEKDDEAVCIAVDSPDHLFVMENFTVTHNTFQTIASLHDHPENLPAIIFTPSAVKENWKREILMSTDKLNPRILSGESPYALTPKPNTVYIANYDIAVHWFGEEIKGKTREGKDKLTIKVREHIVKMGFKTIICDEIHMLKNYKAKRTKMLDAFSRIVPNFVGLSGTPMMNKPIELYPIIKMIDPHLFPNMMAYAQRYCGLKKSHWGWDFSGSTNAKELNDILTEHIMLRRLKRDVLTELPPKVNSVIPLEISNRSEYDRILTETIDWVERVGVEQAVKAKKAEAIVRYEKLKQAAIKGKMESLCDWIQNFLDDGCEKLVVFAWHQDVIRELYRRFKKNSVCPLAMGNRQKCVDLFNEDPRARIFFGNVQSEGTGINLQIASNVVKAEIIPSPTLHAQASDRCHRMGQKDSVNIWWMIAEDTIEEKILKSLDRKKIVISGVMDGQDVPDEDLLFDVFTSLKG